MNGERKGETARDSSWGERGAALKERRRRDRTRSNRGQGSVRQAWDKQRCTPFGINAGSGRIDGLKWKKR